MGCRRKRPSSVSPDRGPVSGTIKSARRWFSFWVFLFKAILVLVPVLRRSASLHASARAVGPSFQSPPRTPPVPAPTPPPPTCDFFFPTPVRCL